MYVNGSEEFNKAIDDTVNTALHHRLVFTDDNSVIESISKLNGYISSNNTSELQIGTTNMSYVEVEAYTDKILTGREFRLESGAKLEDGTYEYAPIGYFTVQKPDGDVDIQAFKAFDRMQKLERPYSSSLIEPTTTDKILVEICEICRVTLATPIPTPIEIAKIPQGYTCREVLGYIAGLHAKFACFDRFGELNLRWYSETPIEKKIGVIWSFTRSQENFTVEKIEIAKDSETKYTSGSGFKTVFHSNPLATQEITNSIMATLNGFTYNASSIEMLDDIRLDPWDVIKVTYLDGNTYLVPCMAITQNFSDGSTVIEAYAKSDTENEYRFTGPTIQYLNRMATELLVANRVIATKVDAEYVQTHAITTDKLDAITANITNLVVDEIDGKYANIDLANIDIANINVGKIGELFAKVGLIDRATIVEGHITGFLDAVEVNANKITAGTLIADRILLSGEEGSVLYALNNLGELTSTNVDTLDGYVLTDRTINADKLIANSITANELDVNQIFGNEAVLNKIVSQDAFINAIETNRIIVGASENANKALHEVNKTVKSITMHYLATTLASGVTISTSGWTTTVQQIDATKKYLWTYQTITYVDNTTIDTSPVISGVYGNEGKDGKDGEDGEDGTNGVGITSVVPLYYLKSNTTAPSAPTSAVTSTATSSGVWTKSIPTYVTNYTYFTCTQTQYTNGTYSWSTVVIDNALTNANSTAYTANTTANGIKNNIYKSGTTLIDGAKIYTGSITADQIATDAIKSKNYVVDTSGSFLNLADGSFDSKYLKWDEHGKATITDLKVLNSLDVGSGGVYADYIGRPTQWYMRANKYTGGFMSDIIHIGFETWDSLDNPTEVIDDTVVMSVYGGYDYGVEFPYGAHAKYLGVYELQPYETRDRETGAVLERKGSIGANTRRFPTAYIGTITTDSLNVDGLGGYGDGSIYASGLIQGKNVYANGDVISGHGTDHQASLATLSEMVKMPLYVLTDIDNVQHGIGMNIMNNTLYVSFTFGWISLQFVVTRSYVARRYYYGNNGWSSWENV